MIAQPRRVVPKSGLVIGYDRSAPKGRPNKAQANGLGRRGKGDYPFPGSSPEGAQFLRVPGLVQGEALRGLGTHYTG